MPIEKHDFMFSGNGKQMLGHHSNSRNTAWFSLYDYEYIKTLMPAVISPQLQIISRQIIRILNYTKTIHASDILPTCQDRTVKVPDLIQTYKHTAVD